MISTRDLLDTIRVAKSGCKLDGASLTGSTDGFLFKNGTIYSWSSSLSVMSRLPKDCESLSGVVSSTYLINILSKMKSRYIEIECSSTSWKISSEDKTACSTLQLLEDNISPRIRQLESIEYDWHDLPANFYRLLGICNMMNNTKMTHGIYINGNIMLSSDGRRMNRGVLSGSFACPIWFTEDSAKDIISLESKFTQYSVSSAWVHFRSVEEDGSAKLVFSCNRLDSSLWSNPEKACNGLYERVMSEKSKGVFGKFPNLAEAIDLASVFGEDLSFSAGSSMYSNVISLELSRQAVKVNSSRQSAGAVSKSVSWEEGGKPEINGTVQIKVSADFIRTALSHSSEFALIETVGHSTALVFFGDEFVCIIAAIKSTED